MTPAPEASFHGGAPYGFNAARDDGQVMVELEIVERLLYLAVSPYDEVKPALTPNLSLALTFTLTLTLDLTLTLRRGQGAGSGARAVAFVAGRGREEGSGRQEPSRHPSQGYHR